MKLNLILLTAISAVSALNNPYLVCQSDDYDCKGKQSTLCIEQANSCWGGSTGADYDKCKELNALCDEIWTSGDANSTSGGVNTNPSPAESNSLPVTPNALPVEPNALPVEPNALPVEPNALPVEPNSLPIEPNPLPIEPNPLPVEPNPLPIEPNPLPIEPNALPIEPNALPVESLPAKPSPISVEPNPLPVNPNPIAVEPNTLPDEPVAVTPEAPSVETVQKPTTPEVPAQSTTVNNGNSFKPSKDNVKIFGRAIYNAEDGYLWFGSSAGGIEFKCTGKTVTIDVTADPASYEASNPARYAIYVDNELYDDSTISKENSELTVDFNEDGEHIVRFIKLSEMANGTLRITGIKGSKVQPTPPGQKKIEFIGDSITCGYGVDGTEGAFSTKTEDASKTYAYKVAQKFNADYSLFAFSGFGIISGYTSDGKRNTVSTLPQYYDKLGFSWYSQYGTDNTQVKDVKWDFNEFVPDLIVINLGTNDGSYLNSVSGEDMKQSEKQDFAVEYEKFIGTIRSAYPEAEILCTLGIMGQDLYPQIEEAVESYKSKTGDEKVNAFKFNQQDVNKNGKGIDWHPTPQSHTDAANELIEEIEKLYGWTTSSSVDIDADSSSSTSAAETEPVLPELQNPQAPLAMTSNLINTFDENDLEAAQETVQETVKTAATEDVKSYPPSKDNVKILGRAIYDAEGEYLWFGASAGGIEFKCTGKTVTIDVTADSSSYEASNPARYAIYTDNKLYVDSTISKKQTELTVELEEDAEHVIRFIKLSESANGTLRITGIKGNKVEPTAANEKKIEFIGDSITCGYGVDGTEGAFSTKTEDASKTYAYKVAQKFNADYSLFAFSGFGVISGYSSDGKRNTVSTLPQYYDKLGFSWYTQYDSDNTQMKDVKWDFNEFVPDLIVINLGTNDGSYLNSVSGDAKKSEKEDFVAEYEKFIGTIRSAYPEAEILCTLGIMGQDLYPQIEEAVESYKNETGDEKVNAFKFNQQDVNKNGKGIDWHPAPQSHIEAANELIEEIEKLYGWTTDSSVDIEANSSESSTTSTTKPTTQTGSTKAVPTNITTKAPPTTYITSKAPYTGKTKTPPASTTAKRPPSDYRTTTTSTKNPPPERTTKRPPSDYKTTTTSTKNPPPERTSKAPPTKIKTTTTKNPPPERTTKAPPTKIKTTTNANETTIIETPTVEVEDPMVTEVEGTPVATEASTVPITKTKTVPKFTTKTVPSQYLTTTKTETETETATRTKTVPKFTTKTVPDKYLTKTETVTVTTTKTKTIPKRTKTVPSEYITTVKTETETKTKTKTVPKLTTKTVPDEYITKKTVTTTRTKTIPKAIPTTKSLKSTTSKTLPNTKTVTTTTTTTTKSKTIPKRTKTVPSEYITTAKPETETKTKTKTVPKLTTKTVPDEYITKKTVTTTRTKTIPKAIPTTKSLKSTTSKTIPITTPKTVKTTTTTTTTTTKTKTIPKRTKTVPVITTKTTTTTTTKPKPTTTKPPKPQPSSDDADYFTCKSEDYACKTKKAIQCYAQLGECWKGHFNQELIEKCEKINKTCSKIFLS